MKPSIAFLEVFFPLLFAVHANAFVSHHPKGERQARQLLQSSTTTRRQAWLTPVGPFCPFASSTAAALDDQMQALGEVGPAIATAMARVQLEMQNNSNTPNPAVLTETADQLERAVQQWETVMTQMRLATDFQALEYAKFIQAHLERQGNNNNHKMDVTTIAAGMKWQAACLRAVAAGTMPPPPPDNLDLAALLQAATNAQEQEQSSNYNIPSMMTMMNTGAANNKVDAQPFDTASLASWPTIQQEWTQLCANHQQLVVTMGAKYGDFDALGKLAFLDAVEKVQEQWQ